MQTLLATIHLHPMTTLTPMMRLPHTIHEQPEVHSEDHEVKEGPLAHQVPLVHLGLADHKELAALQDGKVTTGLEDRLDLPAHLDRQDHLECQVQPTRLLDFQLPSQGHPDPSSRKNYEWLTSPPLTGLQLRSTNG